jgi:hypothetical protein
MWLRARTLDLATANSFPKPGKTLLIMSLGLGALVAFDTQSTAQTQPLIGIFACCLLLYGIWRVSPEVRAQTLLIVVFSSLIEVFASLIWGVYSYKYANLPLFVPPGHGILHLVALSLVTWLKRDRALISAALAFSVVWALLGLVVFRLDVLGAIGVLMLAALLLISRRAVVYAAVVFVVAPLELFGVFVGSWEWHARVPVLGIASGDPPSGAAAGYNLFALLAFLCAPLALELYSKGRAKLSSPPVTLPQET